MAHASRLAWDSREGPPARCRRGIDADRENDGTVSKEVSIEIPLFRDGRLAGGRGTVVRLRDGDLRGLPTGWRPPPPLPRSGAEVLARKAVVLGLRNRPAPRLRVRGGTSSTRPRSLVRDPYAARSRPEAATRAGAATWRGPCRAGRSFRARARACRAACGRGRARSRSSRARRGNRAAAARS